MTRFARLALGGIAALGLIAPVLGDVTAPPPAPAPAIAPAKAACPEPPLPSDPNTLGRGVQRTMTLLATSSPTHHNTVKILFYGQSITEQDWSRQVADDLRANALQLPALLQDGVHLNAWGNFVMARQIERYLVYRPELPKADWQGLSRTYAVGKDVRAKGGRLTLIFHGNRLDVLPALARSGFARSARVLIDGRPLSQRDLFYVTRPQPGPWSTLALVRVDHDKPLQAENWTLTVTSVTPDGSGSTDAVFLSRSGQVRIDPKDFFRPRTRSTRRRWRWATRSTGKPSRCLRTPWFPRRHWTRHGTRRKRWRRD